MDFHQSDKRLPSLVFDNNAFGVLPVFPRAKREREIVGDVSMHAVTDIGDAQTRSSPSSMTMRRKRASMQRSHRSFSA
jgi:hypothetical protein